MKVLGRLLVGEGEHLFDELRDRPVVVRPCRVDVEEEPLEELAFAGRDVDQPVDEAAPRAEVRVHRRPRALQDETANAFGVAQRQLLGDDAAAREAGHVGGCNVDGFEDGGRVVRHHLHGDRPRHHRPACAPVVERGQAVAVHEAVELELPRLDGVAETADEQDVRPLPDLLGPDVEITGADVLAHA